MSGIIAAIALKLGWLGKQNIWSVNTADGNTALITKVTDPKLTVKVQYIITIRDKSSKMILASTRKLKKEEAFSFAEQWIKKEFGNTPQ